MSYTNIISYKEFLNEIWEIKSYRKMQSRNSLSFWGTFLGLSGAASGVKSVANALPKTPLGTIVGAGTPLVNIKLLSGVLAGLTIAAIVLYILHVFEDDVYRNELKIKYNTKKLKALKFVAKHYKKLPPILLSNVEAKIVVFKKMQKIYDEIDEVQTNSFNEIQKDFKFGKTGPTDNQIKISKNEQKQIIMLNKKLDKVKKEFYSS